MDEEPKKECVLCQRVMALVGVALGIVFVYISVDLLSGGKLTGLWSPMRVEVDNDDA